MAGACGSGGCGPSDGNAPLCDGLFAGSLGVALQAAIDVGRRIPHELGLRRERVFLVWQQQDPRTKRWVEFRRIELVPVKVDRLDEVDRVVGDNGMQWDGTIDVSEVSPAQVSIATLQGKIDGEPWADESGREFFYEVQRYKRCAGDRDEPRLRFTPSGEVAQEDFGYMFSLLAQHNPRTPEGRDQGLAETRRRVDVKVTT